MIKPHFVGTDIHLFTKYVNTAKTYFEFGSGGSTYFTANIPSIDNIYSVESDMEWFSKLNADLSNRITIKYVDICALPKNWGNPGPDATDDMKRNYTDSIYDVSDKHIDVMLIDGRFRVACGLKSFNVLDDESYLIIDDYLNRPGYHILNNYYDIVERGNVMVVMKKKKDISPPTQEIISKYELKHG